MLQVAPGVRITFDKFLSLVNQLSKAEMNILKEKLEMNWEGRFDMAMNMIRKDVPGDIPEEEILMDIEKAIREVRETNRA